MPIDNVTEFILYIAPGFIAIYIYNSYYPSKQVDSFTKIASSLVFGVSITYLIKWVDKSFFNNVLYSDDSILSFRFIFALFVGGCLFGLLMIGQKEFRYYLSRNDIDYRWINKDKESTWTIINKDNDYCWALVFLKDNSIYFGWIKRFDNDPEESSPGFLLQKAARLKDNLDLMYSIDGIGVFIETGNVNRIEYRDKSISITKTN